MSWLSSLIGVLFVGHSLFGPTNPQMMSEVLAENGVRVDYQIINGAPLRHNWENGASAQGLNARRALASGAYDAVILTEAIPLANHLRYSDTVGTARKYHALAVENNPQARVYLQETWHDLRSGTGVAIDWDESDHIPWLQRIEQDLSAWQGVVDAVNAERAPGTEPMRLIPAGQAMALLAYEIRDGTVPGLRRIEDVFHDSIHPNDLGFYYLTMVQYAAITGESPAGLPRRLTDQWGQGFDAPSPALAARLQELAWQAVAQFRQATPTPPAQAQKAQATPPEATGPPPTLPDPPPGAALPSEPGPVPRGIGLAKLNDWSVQQPFIDVFKTARRWIGHKPRQYGGATHDDLEAAGYLDADGWPLSIPPELGSIGTLVLTDLPEYDTASAGRYVLTFAGKGIVEVTGRATGVRYGPNRVSFDFTPGPGSVDIRIQRSGPGNAYVRDIAVVKEENQEAHAAGALFNPLWLARLDGFRAVRFMDWMATNDSEQSRWEDRPKPDDYSYYRKGVPVEVMVALLNRAGLDGWFNMPHKADDDYIRRFAEVVRDQLAPDRRAYVEYSNEVWNWQFQQAHWADEQALARWGKKDRWVEYYAARAVEMAEIWTEVFGEEAADRLVRVISTQTGWRGLEEQILNSKLWMAEAQKRKPPAAYFDAYAITGYFGGTLGWEDRREMVTGWLDVSRRAAEAEGAARGLNGAALENFVALHRFDVAVSQARAELRDGAVSGDPTDTLVGNLTDLIAYHAEVADRHGLDLIVYEGGSHVVGTGPLVDDPELTEFYTHLNYTPEMGALYSELLAGWKALGGGLFMAFQDVYRPNRWGSWGHLRHLDDANPRWDALTAFQ
ncbi:hypothetical protein SAMN05444007_102135 [Cribrihabitans marinus]|uniref:Uncharacterized protein n=1 Tax=Cribrihabitans marinus TaxID=1227549 RepID=A0A1H6SXX8_9RHOB|nr:hypothetical protein [Cribrihabitans marinus]GGH23171.1 hypothetical protein GCM10010973_08900 [Cribrihabitans marinus]SEI68860.1 hypothetical protein SAMN05444007_102135 [Cribrihabitans marinus]